jgi:hypothetical protein
MFTGWQVEPQIADFQWFSAEILNPDGLTQIIRFSALFASTP